MKEQILQATEKLIRLQGLTFTVDDLAKELGVSKKTLYQYFESKEKIFEALMVGMRAEMNRKQVELFEDETIPAIDKMKRLLTMLPSNYELITPVTLNQMKRSYPKLYHLMMDMYHYEWTRFDKVYEKAVETGEIQAFDVAFFKELYIAAVMHLPEVSQLSKYSYQDIMNKTVEQLFNGVR